eukprot:1464060-Pyramimonas_sp.AAC.1
MSRSLYTLGGDPRQEELFERLPIGSRRWRRAFALPVRIVARAHFYTATQIAHNTSGGAGFAYTRPVNARVDRNRVARNAPQLSHTNLLVVERTGFQWHSCWHFYCKAMNYWPTSTMLGLGVELRLLTPAALEECAPDAGGNVSVCVGVAFRHQ